jgi:hypothetical protein
VTHWVPIAKALRFGGREREEGRGRGGGGHGSRFCPLFTCSREGRPRDSFRERTARMEGGMGFQFIGEGEVGRGRDKYQWGFSSCLSGEGGVPLCEGRREGVKQRREGRGR